MCGFIGIIKKKSFPVSEIDSLQMDKLLYHRGPDGAGSFQNENVYFYHRRLKIVDLGDDANQPFFCDNQRYLIVYNGECYNFKEVRAQLLSRGVKFRTTSDTEVVLKSYISWGNRFIDQLDGMFSFIIYDFKTNSSVICRDRLGIKPLYYFENEKALFFSSEIKPILYFNRAELNTNSLWSYFNLRYVAGDETLFKGVTEVTPGELWAIRKREIVSKKKFWDLRAISVHADDKNDPHDLFDVFKNSIERHTIGDVSFSAFLSGGIDSASLVAMVNEMGFRPRTLTMVTDDDNSELTKAQNIASLFRCSNEGVFIEDKDFTLFRKAIFHLEDPIGDSIIVPSLILSEKAALKDKVVFSGEGADEIFSGYIHHQFLGLESILKSFIAKESWKYWAQKVNMIPLSFFNFFFPYPAHLGSQALKKLHSHLLNENQDPLRHLQLISLFNHSEKEDIFSAPLKVPQTFSSYWNSMEGQDFHFLDKLKRFDLFFWGRNYTLHRLDRLTMANSLEARVPFFDHHLIEFMLKIPASKLYHPIDPKAFFRKSLLSTKLPQEVIRRKKQAFYLPIEKVFSSEKLSWMKEQVLDNVDKRSFLNKRKVENLFSQKYIDLFQGKKLQVIFNFEIWAQEFLD